MGKIMKNGVEYAGFGSMPHNMTTKTSTYAVTTSYTTYATLDVSSFPEGSVILCGCLVNFTGSATATGRYVRFAGTATAALNTWGSFTSFSKVITKPTNGILSLEVQKDNSSAISVTDAHLWAVRIS